MVTTTTTTLPPHLPDLFDNIGTVRSGSMRIIRSDSLFVPGIICRKNKHLYWDANLKGRYTRSMISFVFHVSAVEASPGRHAGSARTIILRALRGIFFLGMAVSNEPGLRIVLRSRCVWSKLKHPHNIDKPNVILNTLTNTRKISRNKLPI